MRPTFLAFQTASRALAASQAGIDVTGNNIAHANANVDGSMKYTRQRADLTSISNSGYTQKYALANVSTGLGVSVNGISQIRDPFLDARFRTQAAESSQYDTLLAGLSDLENVIDEADNPRLQNEISNFIKQLQTLSTGPTGKDLALVARTAADKIVTILNTYAAEINGVRDQQIHDLTKVVVDTDFNTIVKNIANLNTQIREELTHGNTPNELYDQRNALIDKLSGIANIKVSTTPEKISEDLTIENLEISIYDPTSKQSVGVVRNGLYNTLTASMNQTTNQMEIEINSSFGGYYGNITSSFTGGAIKGYLDLINGDGTYADTSTGGNPFRGTLYYTHAMDTFASNFARVLNDLNVNHTTGDKMPLFTNGSGGSDPGDITAANIRISAAWAKDPQYIDTTTTAAYNDKPENVMRMIDALEGSIDFYRNGDTSSSKMFAGTAVQYMTGLIGELSLDVELHTKFSDTSNAVLNNLYVSRESMSGVNLDEEGVNLMAFQKSYNAAARYFNVLDEAVDKIINEMGLVGR